MISPQTLLTTLTFLSLSLSFPILPTTSARPTIPTFSSPKSQPQQQQNMIKQLDARGLPITATTTITVEATSTYTIWDVVGLPTGQVPMGVGSSSSSSSSVVVGDSTSTGILEGTTLITSYSTGSTGAPTSMIGNGSIVIMPTQSVSNSMSEGINSSNGSQATTTAIISTESIQAIPTAFTSSPAQALVNKTMTSIEAIGNVSSIYSSRTMMMTASMTSVESIAAVPTSSVVGMANVTLGLPSSPISTEGAVNMTTSTMESMVQPTSTEAASSSSSLIMVNATSTSSVVSANPTETLVSSSLAASSSVRANATTSVESIMDVVPTQSSSTSILSSAITASASSSILSTTIASSTMISSSITLASSSSTSTSILSTSTSSSTTTTSSATSSTVSAASATGGIGLSTQQLNERMMAAYYPDWSASELPPANVDFSLFDVVDFAFALPNSAFGLTFTQWNSETSLTALVAYGHAAGKLVRLSIGGWTGSVYFSQAVSTATNRQTFVNNILATYNAFNLDGIDIDWEYPGTQGAGNNMVSSDDSANFLLFLQLLRETLPSTAVISACAQVWPFADSNGNPMSDVSGFAAVLDWVLVMNYDIWGSSPTPGPNAPLSDGCNDSQQPLANAYAAVSSWTTAGMPAHQLMLGVPAYGYLQVSSATKLVDKRSTNVVLYNSDGGSTNGQLDWNSIVAQGALELSSDGTYIGAGGFTREWDSCSSTPWLKSTSSGQVVTYDDPVSLSLKAQFARQAGLRGTNMWDMSGDTANWALTSALRSGLGI